MKFIKLTTASLAATLLLAGCSTGNSNQNNNQNNNNQNNQTQTTQNNTQNQNNAQTTQNNVVGLDVQSEQLGAIVKAFQNQFPNLMITSIKLESAAKPYNYHIEAVDNMKEYDFMYHVAQKHLMLHGEKALDADEQNGIKKSQEGIDITTTSNIDNIIKIALGNDANAKAIAWSIDKDNGKVVWDIKVNANGVVKEVKIDDVSSAILSVDND